MESSGSSVLYRTRVERKRRESRESKNLDVLEAQLIAAIDSVIAAPAVGFFGVDLATAVNALANRCDLLYLHIDSDIFDEHYVPNGSDMIQVCAWERHEHVSFLWTMDDV